jgi:uncharacterized protein YjbJ (UPF0337 family)
MSSSTTHKAKGRVKEALGALTGDTKHKQEGKRDQIAGNIKEAAEKIVDKARQRVHPD